MSYYYVPTLRLVELVKRALAIERPQAPTPSPTKNPYYVHTIAESQLQLMLAASSFHEIPKICPSSKGRYCTWMRAFVLLMEQKSSEVDKHLASCASTISCLVLACTFLCAACTCHNGTTQARGAGPKGCRRRATCCQ